MSVILNALRSQKKEVPPVEETESYPDNFAFDKKNFIARRKKNQNKRVIVLASIFGALVILAIGLQLLKREPKAPPVRVYSHSNTAPAPSQPQTPSFPPKASSDQPLSQAQDYFKKGELDKSLALFQDALEADPNNALINNNIGMIFLKKGLYTSAMKYFTRSLEIDSECAECLNNLGYLKTILGFPIEAEKYLKKASLIKNDYPDPHFNLGVLYEKKEQIGEAVEAYAKFVELAPDKTSDIMTKVKQHLWELTGKEY